MTPPRDALRNRRWWDRTSDEYQTEHGPQLARRGLRWGVWGIPESKLRVLGEVAAKDVLELGCGAAQCSIRLAEQGARPTGLDNSWRQLAHARRLAAQAGSGIPLVHANAEHVPFADESFDIVFCDHGAMSFADPYRTVPEASRVLRAGGLLAFCMNSPILDMCWPDDADRADDRLHTDYFGMHRFAFEEGSLVEYQLRYGEWIRLFRQHAFDVEDLIEIRPPGNATSTYRDEREREWARRWPAENVWRARKVGAAPTAAG